MDLFPRIIEAAEWLHLERGLAQRLIALNRFLDDLYVGEQAAIEDGVVPRWVVTSSAGFERQAFGIDVPFGARCMIAGIDLVRGIDGDFAVLEDNLRNPSGISYVLENRAAMAKAFPRLFGNYTVRPVEQYGQLLRATLEEVAPASAGDEPNIVILTPGAYNSAYFEHALLARAMGVELVEGRDLVVDDQVVYSRTVGGLSPVDVIYRRIDDDFLDPVSFRPDSTLGVPGLLSAARAGTVTLCNAMGNGVADDKAMYPYVPDLIRYYLSEEPLLSNVPTYVMWDDDQRRSCLDRLDQMVIKPVSESGGYGIVIGPHASDGELENARANIEADHRNWIVQLFAVDETKADDHAEIVSVQTHAWVEAGLPNEDWMAIDPTNDQPVGERHVVIGFGRDYDDVAPVRGVYAGHGVPTVDATVEMRRMEPVERTMSPRPRRHAQPIPYLAISQQSRPRNSNSNSSSIGS